MRKTIRVTGKAGDQLVWICRVLETTPEEFIASVLPFHMNQIVEAHNARQNISTDKSGSGESKEVVPD